MTTFLVIIGIIAGIILLIFLGLVYSAYQRRPKHFKGALKPLEKKLFAELEKHLPVEVGPLIARQLDNLKRGVRLYFPKSYVLELYEDKASPLPQDILFARMDEFKLASLMFSHGASRFRAEFSTYNGRVWGVTIRPSVSYMLQATNITNIKFKLFNDPSETLNIDIKVEFFEEGADVFQLRR